MTHARQHADASDEPVTWHPLTALPLVSHLIDSALTDSAEHIETLTKVSTKPHVLDDAIVDRTNAFIANSSTSSNSMPSNCGAGARKTPRSRSASSSPAWKRTTAACAS